MLHISYLSLQLSSAHKLPCNDLCQQLPYGYSPFDIMPDLRTACRADRQHLQLLSAMWRAQMPVKARILQHVTCSLCLVMQAGTANSSSISVDGIAIAADAIPVTLLNIQHQQQEDGTLPSQLPAAAADSPPAADSSSSSSSPAATQLPPGAAAPEEEVSSHPSMVLNEKHLNPEHLRNLTKVCIWVCTAPGMPASKAFVHRM